MDCFGHKDIRKEAVFYVFHKHFLNFNIRREVCYAYGHFYFSLAAVLCVLQNVSRPDL